MELPGACGSGGDNIRLVMKRKTSRPARGGKLQTLAGVTPRREAQNAAGHRASRLVEPSSALADHALMNHVSDFYHQTFLNQPAAMHYLQKRCCLHPEAVKLFRLGYANRTLGYRVPATTAEGKKLKAQLQQLGILRASGHEHLNGSVVVPILDEHGNSVQMYGRKIVHNLRPGTPDHLYLPGDHRAVWNRQSLVQQKEWLLCESILDALTLWCAGFRNVTCAYGVNGWTALHWSLLDAVKPERVIICFDNDDAGNQASARLGEQMKERGVAVLGELPPGQDINMARAHPSNPLPSRLHRSRAPRSLRRRCRGGRKTGGAGSGS